MLEEGGILIDLVLEICTARETPTLAEEFTVYDVVVLRGIRHNTPALPSKFFNEFEEVQNRIQLFEDYVRVGGGLTMVDGYLTFQGFNAKANYKNTAIERCLPAAMQSYDDRIERSDGISV